VSQYLLVVNQEDDFAPVARFVADRAAQETGASFDVIVPATRVRGGPQTEGRELAAARARLSLVLEALGQVGVAEVPGEVVDGDLMIAVENKLRAGTFDGIILATGPARVASALGVDLADRIERAFGVPVVDIVDPHVRPLAGHNIGFGVNVDARDRPAGAPTAHGPRKLRVRWSLAAIVLVLVAAVAVLVTVLVRGPSAGSSASGPLAVTVGGPEDHGATQELTGYYPAIIEAHPGDTVTFHNDTIDVPHTVSFGVAFDRSNQPKFGGGIPNVALVQPCTTTRPLTVGTSRCNPQRSGLPPFDGQHYYSSGVIAPGSTFVLHLAANIAPGSYSFGCLIHPAQHGTLIVVPSDVAIQSKSQLQKTAASELARDRTALARLLTTRVVPPAGVTVQAGETTGEVSVNQFFPQTVTIKAGQTVTWENPTLAPHVILVDGGLDPSAVTFARPKPPSGADYSSGFADSGPIGAPPYPFRTYRLRFMRPGTYTVICSFHPGMIGRVIVTP
jgi:plastocyanin